MHSLCFHLTLAVILIFTGSNVPTAECATSLDSVVGSLTTQLEQKWDTFLLDGPLKFLADLRSFQLIRSAVRFAIDTFIKLPFEATLKVFDFVCNTLTRQGIIGRAGLIKEQNLAVILIDDEGQDRIVLEDLEKITESTRYVANSDLVVFIPGWSQKGGSGFDSVTKTLVEAFNQRYDRMFAVLDLGASLNNLYSWSAYNAREVGNMFGIHLSKLVDKIPAERIHLIGAGLGAQIAGFAGRKFEGKTKKQIGRITGLDPSQPCFANAALDSTAAAFVDIIHTSKLFGTFDTKGHVNFFVNRISTLLPPQGCTNFYCLHQRAVLYLAESVLPENEYNFCGVQCESRNRFEMAQCIRNEVVYLGLSTSRNARGSYYLNTNVQSPYGQCNPQRTTPAPITEGTTSTSSSPADGSSTIPNDTTKNEEKPDEPTTDIVPDK